MRRAEWTAMLAQVARKKAASTEEDEERAASERIAASAKATKARRDRSRAEAKRAAGVPFSPSPEEENDNKVQFLSDALEMQTLMIFKH